MSVITEYHILDLDQELNDIKFVVEGINLKQHVNIFKWFSKLNPNRLVVHIDKVLKLPLKLKKFAKLGFKFTTDKMYIKHCNEFIQSKTYFDNHDAMDLVNATHNVMVEYLPSDKSLNPKMLKSMAWAVTTLSVGMHSKEKPNERLNKKELIAYIKNIFRKIQSKINMKSKNKVKYIFFISLLFFLINSILLLSMDKDIFPKYIIISNFLVFIYFLNYFIVNESKSSKEPLKENKKIIKENKIFDISNLTSYIKSPDKIINNLNSIKNIFKKNIPNGNNNLKTISSKLIFAIEKYFEKNTDIKQVSNLASRITKYIISLFDITARSTLLLPISWLAIILITISWKNKNPGKKITKEIIWNIAKEYFYKSNLKWSKYKANSASKKRMSIYAIIYIYLSLLLLYPAFSIKLGQDLIQIRTLFIFTISLYMIEAINTAQQTINEGFQNGYIKSSLERLPLPDKLAYIKQQIYKMTKLADTTGSHTMRSSLLQRIKKLQAGQKKAEEILSKRVHKKNVKTT